MIFGQTERDQIMRASWKMSWHPAYAWRPVRLLDGRWVWLETVERISYFASEIRLGDHATAFGRWCFRLPSPTEGGTP